MKRLVVISVAGILAVGVSAILVLRDSGGGRDATSAKTSAPSVTPSPSLVTPSPSPTTSPAVQATAAPCEPDVMLPVIRAQIPIANWPGVFFASVDIME